MAQAYEVQPGDKYSMKTRTTQLSDKKPNLQLKSSHGFESWKFRLQVTT